MNLILSLRGRRTKQSPDREGEIASLVSATRQPPRNDNHNMKTIICHAFPAWDAPYIKSTVELMTRLCKEHRVIYFDYHYTWKDIFKNSYCPKRNVLGLEPRKRTVNTPHGQIEVYSTPPVLPTNWINNQWLFKTVTALNGWWIRRHVRKLLRQVSSSQTTMINALNPVFGMLTKKAWKVKKKVYYCYDELKGTAWSNKWGPAYEARYLKEVDQVICTSTKLQVDKARANSNCHVVKNGVNLDIFKARTLEKVESGVIGYIGAVDNRIDFKLIKYVASKYPKHQFHFFGSIKTDIPTNIPENVSFFGAKKQEELPAIIDQLEACIIPFVKNELTAAIYPLKINEYLSMGKPVVTTDFSDLSDFEGMVSIADHPSDFTLFLKREMKGNSRLRIQRRIDFAQGNSWKQRTQSLDVILREPACRHRQGTTERIFQKLKETLSVLHA